MADFEINIPASAVKELKKAMDMGFGVDISLSIGGNVTVSGGGVPAAIQDALDESTNTAFFIDTSDAGGFEDAATVNSFTTAEGVTFTAVTNDTATYSAANRLLSLTVGGFRSSQLSLGSNMDFYCVINTADTAFMLSSVDGDPFFGCAQDGITIGPDTMVGTPTYYANGVAITPNNRDALRDAWATGSDVVISCRGLDLSNVEWDQASPNTPYWFRWDALGFELTGLVGDALLCDARDNTSAAAIEAALAERHGITL